MNDYDSIDESVVWVSGITISFLAILLFQNLPISGGVIGTLVKSSISLLAWVSGTIILSLVIDAVQNFTFSNPFKNMSQNRSMKKKYKRTKKENIKENKSLPFEKKEKLINEYSKKNMEESTKNKKRSNNR